MKMAFFEMRGIRKSFGRTEVLKGVDLTLDRGQTLAIIGSSGSGKTTMLRCINFLEVPDQGTISLGGEQLLDAGAAKKLSEKELRALRLRFGLVFQNFNLFPQYTVLGNLCLAPQMIARDRPDFKKNKKQIYKEIEEKAYTLLEKVGMSEKAQSYPCQLSGGQQQRVAIARALALSPDILCFDEPTSALDPELTVEVLNVLRALAKENMTMIVVTHEMAFAEEVADRILFLDKGVAEFDGDAKVAFGGECPSQRLRDFVGSIRK